MVLVDIMEIIGFKNRIALSDCRYVKLIKEKKKRIQNSDTDGQEENKIPVQSSPLGS